MTLSRSWRSVVVVCVTIALCLLGLRFWRGDTRGAHEPIRIGVIENPEIVYAERNADNRRGDGQVSVGVVENPEVVYDDHNASRRRRVRGAPTKKPQAETRRKGRSGAHGATINSALVDDSDVGASSSPSAGWAQAHDHTPSADHALHHRCLHHDPHFVARVYAATEVASVLDVHPQQKETFTTTTSSAAPSSGSSRSSGASEKRNEKTDSQSKNQGTTNNTSTTAPRGKPRFEPPPPSQFRPLRVRVDASNLFHTGSFCSAVGDVREDFLGGKVECTREDILTSAKRQYILRVVVPELVDRAQRMIEVGTVSPGVARAYARSAARGSAGSRATHAPDQGDDGEPAVAVPLPADSDQPARTRLVVPRKACARDGIHIPLEHGEDGVADADLVIYALAGPIRDQAGAAGSGGGAATTSTTLAWSSYCAVDVYGRPTVAHLNFVPSSIEPSRTTTLQRLDLPADVAADSDNGRQTTPNPFGGSFTGVTSSDRSSGSASSVPSGASGSRFSSFASYTHNSRFSVCPVQLSSTASATATSATVRPAALGGDGDEWWTLKYVRTMMHEMLHILGFAPPLLTAYAITSVHRGEPVTMLSEPGTVRAARAFFECSTLDGVELEDEGGDGTALGHWERLWMRDDIMSGVPSTISAVSSVTLAFLDSLPFYRVKMAYAEPMPWGAGAGCDFLEKSCKPLGSAAGIARLANSQHSPSGAAPSGDGESSGGVNRVEQRRHRVQALSDDSDPHAEPDAEEVSRDPSSAANLLTTMAPRSSTTTSTTLGPTGPSTTSTQRPTTTTSSTTTAVPGTTTTSTKEATPTSTTSTTTTTTKRPIATSTSTTTRESTSTTSTSTTTTTVAPVVAENPPESRTTLLARAKYWCVDKGQASLRVPQCTYDRRSIGICNVDFKRLKSESGGGYKEDDEESDGSSDATHAPMGDDSERHDSAAEDGDESDAQGSDAYDPPRGNATDRGSEHKVTPRTDGEGANDNATMPTPIKRSRRSTTGRSLLMNGCPVVEPFLNRWCTNGLLSIDLAPDTEQDILVRSQGYYFGPQSRCARVDDFKRVSASSSPRSSHNTATANNTNTTEEESDVDAATSYLSPVEAKEDVQEMNDARCLRMRCVLKDSVSTHIGFSAEFYRLEIQVGGLWLACPRDGRSGYIAVPAETGFAGTLACEESELLCTADLVYHEDTEVPTNRRATRNIPPLPAKSAADMVVASPSQWLSEYALPSRLLLAVTLPNEDATTRASQGTSSDSSATERHTNKKDGKSKKNKEKKQIKNGSARTSAAASDGANESALLLSAWRLVAEQCPVELEVALQHDLDALLVSASQSAATATATGGTRAAPRTAAFSPLSTFVKQREGSVRLFPPFTVSLWHGEETVPVSSVSASRVTRSKAKQNSGKQSGRVPAARRDLAAAAWLQAHTGSDAAPPLLIQVGFFLAVTTSDPDNLDRYARDLTTLAWRANSTLRRVEVLLATAYRTLTDGGSRHMLCGLNWEVPLPGMFAQLFSSTPASDGPTPHSQLWTDAVVLSPQFSAQRPAAVPLDGPMLPPQDVSAVAQFDLELRAMLPPGRARASMLSHPLMRQALKRDVSALLGVTSNLIVIQNVVWAPDVTERRSHYFAENVTTPRQLLSLVRSAFTVSRQRASAIVLPAGEAVLGTITAVVYAQPLPETLRFTVPRTLTAMNTSRNVSSARRARDTSPLATMRVRSDAVQHMLDLPEYTRQYWADILAAAASDRLPLRMAGDALVELLNGAPPGAPSLLFPSATSAAKSRDEDSRVTGKDLSSLTAYDELQMFRQRGVAGEPPSSTTDASPLSEVLEKRLAVLRTTLTTGDVWLGAVLSVRDGAPSSLPSACHASMADSPLERVSSVSLRSLMTPSFLRRTSTCRRWRLHGGMSWCLSVYEGHTCAEADTVEDAVWSFCVNIRTVWFALAAVTAALLLAWVYGLTVCCWRFCCGCWCCGRRDTPSEEYEWYD